MWLQIRQKLSSLGPFLAIDAPSPTGPQCFIGNHYHFVLQTRQPNLSLLMRHINGVYTQRFNQRHRKVGHLFQGRFKAVPVDCDSYLLEVCRYVERNPARACMVAAPGDWPWGSFAALTGQAPCPPWLDRAAE